MLKKFMERSAVRLLTWKGYYDLHCMRRNAGNARKTNDALLMSILKKNKNTEYGRKYGFAEITSPEDFKKKVPVIGFVEIEDEVTQIYETGKRNGLCADKTVGFATSSGSIGRPKVIPRTKKEVGIYTKYTVTRFLALADQYRRKEHGLKGFHSDKGICTLMQHPEVSPLGLPATNVADIGAKRYYFIYPKILVLPMGRQFRDNEIDIIYACVRFGLEERDAHYLFAVFAKTICEFVEYLKDHWPMLVEDIRSGRIADSIAVQPLVKARLEVGLKPNPERAEEIRRECEKGFDETILSRLWPNLSVISAIGTSNSFEGFVKSVRQYSRGILFDCSIYGASEGLIAACYRPGDAGQLMLPDSCYYEFVDSEADTYDETLSLDELSVGKCYEILITNQSGFYRYRLKDVIRVLRYEGDCPVINFVYRKGQLLNINGEKTTMEQMSEAVIRLERATGIRIKEWTVFVGKGTNQYHYGLLTESDGDLSGCSEVFEQILRNVNTSYKYYEGMGLIDPPVIINQKPGTHDIWREKKIAIGATREQVKPVRILDTEDKTAFFLASENILA